MAETIYTGEDVEVVIDLVDLNFADVQDVIVGIVVNKILVKTCKKTEATEALKVLAHPTEPTMCMVRLFRSETKTWEPGMLGMEVTIKVGDSGFPLGKHSTYRDNIVLFTKTKSKDA